MYERTLAVMSEGSACGVGIAGGAPYGYAAAVRIDDSDNVALIERPVYGRGAHGK